MFRLVKLFEKFGKRPSSAKKLEEDGVLRNINFSGLVDSLKSIAEGDETLYSTCIAKRLYGGDEFKEFASAFLAQPISAMDMTAYITYVDNILPVPSGDRIKDLSSDLPLFRGPLMYRFDEFISSEQLAKLDKKILRSSKQYPMLPDELENGRNYISRDLHFHCAFGVLGYLIRKYTEAAIEASEKDLEGTEQWDRIKDLCMLMRSNAQGNSMLHDLSPFLADFISRENHIIEQMKQDNFKKSLSQVYKRDVFRSSVVEGEEQKTSVCPFSSVFMKVLSLKPDENLEHLQFGQGQVGDFFKYLYKRVKDELPAENLYRIRDVNNFSAP